MNDTISRQAAIDALEKPLNVSDTRSYEYNVGEQMQWEKDVKALNRLPSAPQETQCEVLSDGTAHITADIDVSAVTRVLLSQAGTHYGDLFYRDDLPSAQPEITRCKDCKYYEWGWYCSAWNNSPGFPMVTEEGYCNLAERRNDENNNSI